MTRQIIGAMGGKSGGASFITKPDTLRSNDSFEILLGLGSGRWKGLTNGLKSFKINGVPMENADGSSNFKEIYTVFADGNPLQDQLVKFQLGGGGSNTAIGTTLVNTNPIGTPGPWVVGAVDTPNADFIDLRFVVQQLFYQDSKSIRENTAHVEIEMRPSGFTDWIRIFEGSSSNSITYDPNGYDLSADDSGGTTLYLGRELFTESGVGFQAALVPNLTITGKTTSPSVKEIRIAVPNTGIYANKTWEVRARLIEKDTIDNNTIQERRTITFESITAIITDVLGDHPDWDGQVWMQIYGKASDQFNGFPEMEGIFDTKICKTPPSTVWNPDTRIYTNATWDGSYEEHFTTDPAWQLKEFVEDPIHGIAGLQPGSTLDKWDALEASKYYSELVPDGKGGTHPRFNMNLTITESQDINEMMGFLAGSVNSYTEDVGGGVWRLKVDKPESPVMVFTNDNVFGEFKYSHTDVDSRFNDWRGTFLNEDMGYETDTVRVFDQDDIDENGIRFTEIALIGCTNRQEALRRLMFRLRVSLNEYKLVSFSTNRIGRYLSPLETILIADNSLNPDQYIKSTSRLESHAGTTVTLKGPLRLEVGVNYTITFALKDKSTVTRTVMNTGAQRGDVTTIYIDSALPSDALPESAVALQATNLPSSAVPYRIISVEKSEEDEDTYSILASIIDSGKWNAMDNVSETELLEQEGEVSIDAPTPAADGMFTLVEFMTDIGYKRVLQANWNRPSGAYLQGYRVEYRLNDGPWQLAVASTQDSYFELQNPEDGIYDFKITALDRRGVQSEPLIERYVFDGFDDDPGRDGNNALIDDTFAAQWWVTPPPATRIVSPESATGYALQIPFVANTSLRVHNTAQRTKLARTKVGEALWVRVIADPDGGSTPINVTYGEEDVTFASSIITYGETPGVAANFPLEVAIDWLDLEGTYVSRTILGTLSATNGSQVFTGYANAPFRGLARISIGYPSQADKEGSWVVYEPWMGEHQPTADNTSEAVPVMTLAPSPTINVTNGGVSNTPFPLVLPNVRQRGSFNVTRDTAWQATFPQGMTATINNTPGDENRGRITITGFSGVAQGLKIQVTSTYEGVALSNFIPVNVVVASATTGSTGGGTPGTSSSDSTIQSTNYTFYNIENAGPMAVTTGSNGEAILQAALSFNVSDQEIYSEAAGKWQWRVPNADPTVGWADVAAEVSSAYGAYRYVNTEPEFRDQYNGYYQNVDDIGSITVNATKTGLSPNTSYQFRLLLRSLAGTTLYFSGTASAQGT